MWQFRLAVCSGAMLLFLAACASTGNPGPEEMARAEFRRSLAERQVARRRETADICLRRGVRLPEDYVQKGGGMLEEYVPGRFPCGMSAEDRMARAEEDFRHTWEAVMGTPVSLNHEWLLAVKRRLAGWVDAGVLTPDQARATLREAQWTLVNRKAPTAGPAPQSMAEIFAELDTSLNQALAEHGISCRRDGKSLPC